MSHSADLCLRASFWADRAEICIPVKWDGAQFGYEFLDFLQFCNSGCSYMQIQVIAWENNKMASAEQLSSTFWFSLKNMIIWYRSKTSRETIGGDLLQKIVLYAISWDEITSKISLRKISPHRTLLWTKTTAANGL